MALFFHLSLYICILDVWFVRISFRFIANITWSLIPVSSLKLNKKKFLWLAKIFFISYSNIQLSVYFDQSLQWFYHTSVSLLFIFFKLCFSSSMMFSISIHMFSSSSFSCIVFKKYVPLNNFKKIATKLMNSFKNTTAKYSMIQI